MRYTTTVTEMARNFSEYINRVAFRGERPTPPCAMYVEAVLERFPLLRIDLATARVHAQLWSDLASAGTPVGPHDLWLAASAVAHGLVLVTAKLREFRRVSGLAVESWL